MLLLGLQDWEMELNGSMWRSGQLLGAFLSCVVRQGVEECDESRRLK